MADLAATAAIPVGIWLVAKTLAITATVLHRHDDKRLALGYFDRAIPLLEDFP